MRKDRYITALGYYMGWGIRLTPRGSQYWGAVRHGVHICHRDKEGLLDMIDMRCEQEQIGRISSLYQL